jgi:hypothetical protein
MTAVVIDVNVLIVANARETEQATHDCVLDCVSALEAARENIVVLDSSGLIFGQYQRYNSFNGQPGLGDFFFRWLYLNQGDAAHCEIVTLTVEGNSFLEVPVALRRFDPSDHVYIGVANASANNPTILNATDTDWYQWRDQLEQHGFQIKFLCPDLMTKPRASIP